ncbi:LysR family transcriptional regulator [Marinomonas dokdonensis]|uniref:LysR family transcriptional regulator n=1 Tax=Marinomonas dokdonensis TaxID=328224 RepID=UPI00405571AB
MQSDAKLPRKRFHANALYYFDMVYRHGSIREAARHLHVASSAVSRQILKLEDELGVPLFERLANGLRLTSAGEIFAHHVRTVLQDAERMHSELEALQGLHRGHVEIISVEGPSIELIPNLLESFNLKYPNITVGLSLAGSDAIAPAIISGQADIGLGFDLSRSEEIQQLTLARFPLGAVVTPDHPLAKQTKVTLQQCAQHPLIMSKPGTSTYLHMAPLLAQLGVPHASIECNSFEFSRRMVLRGAGIAFQTRIGIEDDLAKGDLVHIPIAHQQPFYSDLGVYVRGGRHLTTAMDFFARALCDTLVSLAETT